MQGHLPGPPSPHFPIGVAPFLGYQATREPSPLEDREAEYPDWLDEDDYLEPWSSGHSPLVKATALVLSLCLIVAGLGTVIEIVLNSR